MFEPSLKLFNDKGGSVVVDDELIASQAKDIKRKTLSCRKRGKKGPVADCVADLSNNKVFGTRLRAKEESDLDNMQQLLDLMPDLLTNKQSVDSHINRGYGKRKVIELLAKKKYKVLMMAATSGSRHYFITKDEVDSKVKDWEKSDKTPAWIEERVSTVHDYILPNDNAMGTLVKIAKRTYDLDNSGLITL